MRFVALLGLLTAGCAPPPGPPVPVPVALDAVRDVDVLFVLDDSASTSRLHNELKTRFAGFLAALDEAGGTMPMRYRFGVITGDLGAGSLSLGACVPGGQGGRLVARGPAAGASCQPPADGRPFLDYDQVTGAVNLPAGQDLVTTFGCMASVGDRGCGFQQPLEAAYRTLHDRPPENQDFLRPDAALALVFLVEADDCSADPATDLFDPDETEAYGPLDLYRCARFGLACDGQLPPEGPSNGPLEGCVGATVAQGGKLIDVAKYLAFFGRPASEGGLKVDPALVTLAGLTPPSEPVVVTRRDPAGCAASPGSPACELTLQTTCVDPPGMPAVRLNQVLRTAPSPQVTAMCAPSYQPALAALAGALTAGPTRRGCIPADVAPPLTATCTVEVAGATLAQCDPAGGNRPCWRVGADPACPSGASLFVLGAAAAAAPQARCR